jgi:hypothetical protein
MNVSLHRALQRAALMSLHRARALARGSDPDRAFELTFTLGQRLRDISVRDYDAYLLAIELRQMYRMRAPRAVVGL